MCDVNLAQIINLKKKEKDFWTGKSTDNSVAKTFPAMPQIDGWH